MSSFGSGLASTPLTLPDPSSGSPIRVNRSVLMSASPRETVTESSSDMDNSVPYVAHLTSTIPAPSTIKQPLNSQQDLSFLDAEDPIHMEPPAMLPYPKPARVFCKQTHVICTLGPASREVPKIVELLKAGMGVARFNFSHGSHEYHSETLANLRKACEEANQLCAVLLDTKGPEIRTGLLRDGGPVTYTEGTEITVTTDYNAIGDENLIALSYEQMPFKCKKGDTILIADGTLMLKITAVNPGAGTATCVAVNTATIGEKKNCNLPGVDVDLPILTAKDEADLQWGVKNDVDVVAISFVRSAADVHRVRGCLGHAGRGIRLISKIENQEGLRNIDEIIAASDGIMVARGDLGMEVPLEKMFHIQKVIIHKCNLAGKPVVTATQMLESMVKNPRPTRAEATDVANAVLDGTDCVMLSGETAAGAYPKDAVEIMVSICEEAEKTIDNYALTQVMLRSSLTKSTTGGLSVIESLASSAVNIASMTQASAIVVLAASGYAARLIAKYRPPVPVVVGVVPASKAREDIGFKNVGVSADQTARQCLLTRGLIPVVVRGKDEQVSEDTKEKLPPAAAAKACVDEAIEHAKALGLLRSGQLVVTMYNVESQCAVIRVVAAD